MANITSIARPYAKAILSVAADTEAYAAWSQMLEFLSLVVADPRVTLLLKDHELTAKAKTDFLCSIEPSMLSEPGKNLIKVLALNQRLLVLPEIYRMYEELRKVAQQQIDMQLSMGMALDAAALAQISQDFASRLHEQVTLQTQIDPSLIAGGKVQIGDRVLDASIKGELKQLYQHLTQ